jgi:hypothetical protein
VLKLNKIYTYREGGDVEIVRLINVYINKGYLYCSLYLFSKNIITTVSQNMHKDVPIIWQILENEAYDEEMSMKLWKEVDTETEFFEFDFE